jgi:hypothetical protein
MRTLYEPQGKGWSFSPISQIISGKLHFYLLWLAGVLSGTDSFAQVLNVTQAAVVEDGFGKIPNLTGAGSVFVKGNYAYVIGTGDVLQILDITLAGLPVHKGNIANGEGGASILRPQAVVVSGNYAYITSYGADAIEIVDVSNPAKPVHKSLLRDGGGVAPFLKGAWGIQVVGNYAYVASSGSNALEIIDISNPALPVHKGSALNGNGSGPFINGPVAVHVVGNYVYLGTTGSQDHSGSLEVFDISNPASPQYKTSLMDGGGVAPFLSAVYAINHSGNHLYTVDYGRQAIQIFDITNPALPVTKGFIKHGGVNPPHLSRPFSIAISGNYAFVGNYQYFNDASVGNKANMALEIIDVSNPNSPVHAAALKNRDNNYKQISEINELFYQCRSVFLVGTKLYLTGRSNSSLTILDVSAPLAPKILGFGKNGSGGAVLGDARDIVVQGNYAYIASYASGLEILDVTNPAKPFHLASVPAEGTSCLSVSGDVAVIGNEFGIITVIDVGDPSAPVVRGQFFSPTSFGRLTSLLNGDGPQGGVLYMTMSSVDPFGNQVYRNHNNVQEPGEDEMLMYSLTDNASQPEALSFYVDEPIFDVSDHFIDGQWHYMTGGFSNSFNIIDGNSAGGGLGPLTKVTLTHGAGGALLERPTSVVVSGNYAYVTSSGSNALEIIDVTDKNNPVHAGSITHGTDGAVMLNPVSVSLSGKYAFVASTGTNDVNGGLEIIDISDPTNPKHYQSFVYPEGGSLIDAPDDVTVSGNYAYITNYGLFQAVNIVYLYGPSITAVSPLTGAAGTEVTVTGTNFNTFLVPSVGGVEATVSEVSENTLKFIVPEGAAVGKVNLHFTGQNFANTSNFIVTPTAYEAAEVLQTSFKVKWTDVGAAQYFIDISNDNFATFLTGYNNKALGKVTELALTGVASGTAYQYRVRSTDNSSASSNSNIIKLLTIPATPEVTAATAVTQTSLSVNWAGVTGADGYLLDVAEDDAFTKFLTGLNGFPTKLTSQAVTGVEPGVTYYYRVRSSNATGVSGISATQSVITIPPSPSAAEASEITSESFIAHWEVVPDITNYFLDVSTDEFKTFLEGYNSLQIADTSALVIELPSGTYYYRVRASNITGTSPNSETITVVTTPGGQPTGLLFSDAAASSVTVSFSAADASPNGYLVLRSSGSLSGIAPVNGVPYSVGASLGGANVAYVGPSLSFFDGGLPTGTTYNYRVFSYNGGGSSVVYLTTDPLHGSVTLDVTPPSITSGANATTISAGNTPTFTAIITDNISVTSAKIYYRGISRKEFKVAEMIPVGTGGVYSLQIQTTWYDSLGIEYYFWATDGNGNESLKAANSFAQLVSPSLSLPGLPSGTTQNSYRIVSFPYQLPVDNKVTTVYNGVEWDDQTKAALYRWNPELKNGAGDYDKFGPASNLQTIDVGKGYWVLIRSDFAPQLTNVTAPRYNRSNLYVMTLKPKWNQVGNPYPVPISWDDVVVFNQNVNPAAQFSPLTIFNGTGYVDAGNGGLLKPFEGGFVKNLGSSDIDIVIPFPNQTTVGGRRPVIGTNISSDTWKSFLHISQGEFNNDLGGFGMHPQSISGEDRHDNFNPPRFLDIPEVNFMNGQSAGTVLSTSMVKPQDEYIWEFQPVGKEGEVATLTWNSGISSGTEELYLLDEEEMRIVSMLEANRYDFTLTKNSRLRIFYGRDIRDKITTRDVRVGQAYPNPLAREGPVMIPLGLPDTSGEYNVMLQLFDARGNPMAIGSYTMRPGLQTVLLDLDRKALGSGVYVYRLSVGSSNVSKVFTGKIVKP